MTDGATRLTLSNGLTLLLQEIHTAPLVSQWIWYRVGSRDETAGKTGLSHWVEHLQFKGTPTYPAGVLDRAISREGGYWNAATFLDWTTYYETLPADKIDLALHLEADRMRGSLFSPEDVETERTVIISERQGNENEPMFLLGEAVQKAAFRLHSYKNEVIGELADLELIQREDLYRHYQTYYTPSNAVLSLAGDFETGAMIERLSALYEGIPAGNLQPPTILPEPPLEAEQHVMVEGPGETTYIEAAYRGPAANHPDFWPLTVLDSLLTGASSPSMFGGGLSNKTSRLYRALVEKELAVGISGGQLATLDPYLYSITLVMRPERQPEQALTALEDEIRRIQDNPPDVDELRRAVKQSRALFAYSSESISNQASWLGFAEMLSDANWFYAYLGRIEQVTPADIERVAQVYLRPDNRVLGIYLPTGEEPEE